ncbi:hypothetical protein AKJ65_06660 [candidate division MSBL1 archaeon SCGC-AAA259E19]|uniref:Uncharacterized protein n=1 Tax=candidate division MSBL1 archaeon SCGC-AAA259E19 TaxID=1698264 RepID=A0A133UG22_9EURY|nr:hypothetical protein AKJ65_06660 [candidate division MSBL1 archaeon SCGC-AAA259E19]
MDILTTTNHYRKISASTGRKSCETTTPGQAKIPLTIDSEARRSGGIPFKYLKKLSPELGVSKYKNTVLNNL